METATSVLKKLCGGSYLFQVDSVYFLLIKLALYRINQLVRKFLMTARKISAFPWTNQPVRNEQVSLDERI